MQAGSRSSRKKFSGKKISSTKAAANKNLDEMPIGDLGIIALPSSEEMGEKINNYIVQSTAG